MHFTGALHAVTVHDPEKILWRRVMDLCERQLRGCEIGLGAKFDVFLYRTGFDITAASEVMAIPSWPSLPTPGTCAKDWEKSSALIRKEASPSSLPNSIASAL